MRSAVIAGVYEFPERTTTRSVLEIQALSARAALADAGLAPKDVNGYFTVGTNPGVGPLATVDYLNLHPTYIDGTTIGGSSFVAHVNHAAAAIAEGRCRVALITYGARRARPASPSAPASGSRATTSTSSRRSTAPPPSASMRWWPGGTCTSTARRRNSWRRSRWPRASTRR